MSLWTDYNNWFERNERWLMPLTICLLVLMIVLCFTGCVSTETRSDERRVLERVRTPTPDGGEIIRETEHKESGTESVTKADMTAALQSAVAALRGDLPGLVASVIPKPEQQKLLGFTMPEIAAGAGALWSLERGAAIYHKRRRIKLEPKT